VIHSKKSNPDVRLLVLARAADSLYTFLPSCLTTRGYLCSVACTIYQVFREIEISSPDQALVLIARPAMLSAEALRFLAKQYPRLRTIGWCDSAENTSDRAFSATADYGIVLVNDIMQLENILEIFSEPYSTKQVFQGLLNPAQSDSRDRLKYELSEDEITALLGVE
jgi:hypothetical protein